MKSDVLESCINMLSGEIPMVGDKSFYYNILLGRVRSRSDLTVFGRVLVRIFPRSSDSK